MYLRVLQEEYWFIQFIILYLLSLTSSLTQNKVIAHLIRMDRNLFCLVRKLMRKMFVIGFSLSLFIKDRRLR